MRTGSGNESDQKRFTQSTKEFKNPFNLDSLIVAYSALYSQENLQVLKNIKGLSQVPLKIKAAQTLVHSADSDKFTPSQVEGYSYLELPKTYGGIKQRWLVVESEERRESDLKQLEKKSKKISVKLTNPSVS